MPKTKHQNHHLHSASSQKEMISGLSKRFASQPQASRKTPRRSTLISAKISARIDADPKRAKETFSILSSNLTKCNNTEYIGECKENSRIKYFSRKMIAESNDLFSQVLQFYSKKLQKMLEEPVKEEQKVPVGSKRIWFVYRLSYNFKCQLSEELTALRISAP